MSIASQVRAPVSRVSSATPISQHSAKPTEETVKKTTEAGTGGKPRASHAACTGRASTAAKY